MEVASMGLQYPADWKFDAVVGPLPDGAHSEFADMVRTIASAYTPAKFVVETFKEHFGATSGSSTLDWAWSDLWPAMGSRLSNAVDFVDCFWGACEELREAEVKVPSARIINDLLRRHSVPLVIEPPHLRVTSADASVSDSPATAHGPAEFIRGPLLGQGAFGSVYHATRTTSVASFEYALKLLDPSPFVANREKAAARFRRESAALQRLQHRAIIPYIETGMLVGDQPYILMPLVKGQTLHQTSMIGDRSRLLLTFFEILSGLVYLHEQQVLHRDLKPSNIMVRDSDQQPLILDFGCAYLLDDHGEELLTTAHVGFAAYVPPEVFATPTLRHAKQDVYACGVMLYEAAAGRRPDPSDYLSLQHVDISLGSFDAIVRDALAPASRRIPTAQDFLERLQAVA
jgi:serine/threonine protein kinase